MKEDKGEQKGSRRKEETKDGDIAEEINTFDFFEVLIVPQHQRTMAHDRRYLGAALDADILYTFDFCEEYSLQSCMEACRECE